jgi:hypothetical protein
VSNLVNIKVLSLGSSQLNFFTKFSKLEELSLRAGFDFEILEKFAKLKILKINYGGQSEKLNNFINLKRLNKLELIFTPQKDPPLNKKGLKELAIMLPDTEIYLKTRNW